MLCGHQSSPLLQTLHSSNFPPQEHDNLNLIGPAADAHTLTSFSAQIYKHCFACLGGPAGCWSVSHVLVPSMLHTAGRVGSRMCTESDLPPFTLAEAFSVTDVSTAPRQHMPPISAYTTPLATQPTRPACTPRTCTMPHYVQCSWPQQ